MASSIFDPEIIAKRKANMKPRGTAQQVQQRAQRLYSRQLEGKTTRSLVLEHAKTEGVSEITAWEDWKKVKVWNKEDWEKDRENLLPRLQAMRIRPVSYTHLTLPTSDLV